jgi:predicted metal-dependent phosphoesterase TrpH
MARRHLIDMHTHTVFSDGTTTPEDNVKDAYAKGLAGIAVTDHDTGAGIARAQAVAPDDFLIIPGTEFSAEHNGLSVHVLAYFPDFGHKPFADELNRLRNERHIRAEEIVAKFQALDIPITLEQVETIADGAPIGRPHIATAVVAVGGAKDNRDVFDRYLADDGPCYVPKYALDPASAVVLIRASGGAAVLAHPGLYGRDGMSKEQIGELVDAGLNGIEATHPAHTRADQTRYKNMARFFGLPCVAGSDYHGAAKDLALGDASTERAIVEALQIAARG